MAVVPRMRTRSGPRGALLNSPRPVQLHQPENKDFILGQGLWMGPETHTFDVVRRGFAGTRGGGRMLREASKMRKESLLHSAGCWKIECIGGGLIVMPPMAMVLYSLNIVPRTSPLGLPRRGE